MLDKFKLTYRAAKNNKLIPILIPNDTVRGIKNLIQEVSVRAGASRTDLITSNRYRHRASTKFA